MRKWICQLLWKWSGADLKIKTLEDQLTLGVRHVQQAQSTLRATTRAWQETMEERDRLLDDLTHERELFQWAQGVDKLSLKRQLDRAQLAATNAGVRERALQLKLDRLIAKVIE